MNQKPSPLISVIIPVYNAEKYLENCIQSILSQTYNNFELILIDDGSKDNSLSICKQMADNDARVFVVRQDNAGASAARNRGLEIAHGEWIVFVDSDDTVKPNYIEDLYKETIKDHSVVIVVSGVSVYRKESWSEDISFPDLTILIRDYQTIFSNIRLHKYGFSVGKLYKSSIIKNNLLRFDEKVCIAEDMMFMMNYIITSFQCLTEAKITFIKECNYCYQIHDGSLSTSVSSFQQEYYSYNKYKETITSLTETFHIDADCYQSLMSPVVFYVDRCLNAIYNIESRYARLQAMRLIDLDEYKRYKKCNTPFERLLFFLLSTHHLRLYDTMRRLLHV